MSLREQAAREAFVYGVPAVALHRVLSDRGLAPDWTEPEMSWSRLRAGRLPVGLGGLRGAGPADGVPFHGWLDLRSGPVVVTTYPEVPGAAASATFFDLYAEQVGRMSLEPDAPARSLQLAGPSWDPVVSPDVAAVLRCRTDLCLAVGWVSTGAGHGRVRSLRPPLQIRAADGGGPRPPLPDPVPPVDVLRPPTVAFLVVLDWMLTLMPAPPGDEEVRADLEAIGVAGGAGGSSALAEVIAADRVDGQLTGGLRTGFDDVLRRVEGRAGSSPVAEAYLARAARVLAGLRDETPARRRVPRRPGHRPVR